MSGQTTTSSPRPLRADARRNHDTLIEAATVAFNDLGVEGASLEAVAKQAGVGIGTLYRHFPTREALVVAVYEREVNLLCDAAPRLLAEHAGAPDDALEAWMYRFVDYVATKRGLATTLRAQRDAGGDGADRFTEMQVRIRSALGSLVEAAAAAGRIRGDVEVPDLMRAIGGVCMATDDGWQHRSRVMIDLLLDGLRYGAPTPPPR